MCVPEASSVLCTSVVVASLGVVMALRELQEEEEDGDDGEEEEDDEEGMMGVWGS